MNNIARRGPESKVTVEVVKRVSERIAKGIPIGNAVAGEGITEAAYRRQLQRHRELKDIHETAKLRFLDKTFDLITSRPGPMLRWLLERRHSDIFGGADGQTPAAAKPAKPAPPSAPEAQPQPEKKQTIAGIPQEELEEARRRAQSVPQYVPEYLQQQ